jgi:hypothetical protein
MGKAIGALATSQLKANGGHPVARRERNYLKYGKPEDSIGLGASSFSIAPTSPPSFQTRFNEVR